MSLRSRLGQAFWKTSSQVDQRRATYGDVYLLTDLARCYGHILVFTKQALAGLRIAHFRAATSRQEVESHGGSSGI